MGTTYFPFFSGAELEATGLCYSGERGAPVAANQARGGRFGHR